MKTKSILASLALTALLGAVTIVNSVAGTVLNGSGATFPAPIYKQWFKDYSAKHPDIEINYQPVGSGAGIKAYTAGTVDFAASDAAMSDGEIAKVNGDVILAPMTAGSIVLAYNLPGVTDLKLSRDAYVGIFSGKITKWNDPIIAKDNSGATLPATAISVAYRSDDSGTTYVFSKHLAAVSSSFKADILKGKDGAKSVSWPTGTGGKGNPGVTALVQGTVGTIGYVEYGYATTSKLSFATLQNKSGAFVKATAESGASTLASAVLPDNMRVFPSDPAGAGDYPITTFTWVLLHKTYADKAKGAALKDIFNYCLTEGQTISDSLGYIPLPAPVVTKVQAAINSIQ